MPSATVFSRPRARMPWTARPPRPLGGAGSSGSPAPITAAVLRRSRRASRRRLPGSRAVRILIRSVRPPTCWPSRIGSTPLSTISSRRTAARGTCARARSSPSTTVSTRPRSRPAVAPPFGASSASRPMRRSPASSGTSRTGRGSISWSRRSRARFPELRCLLVGGVHRRGAEYAERIHERIARPDLAGHVVLTGARHDVAACLDAMDVVIHASVVAEPFGRVLIEAMAIGRPVIAPREGGPLVIVVDGETGLLVPPRDAGALADALLALLADPARRAAMVRGGRSRVDAVFDIRHHVRAMEALFDEVLARRRGTAS